MRGTVSALCAGILCAVPAACVDRAKTLLHDAARTGDFSEVKALTKAGADPNARAEFGLSPLHYAALGNGNPSVFKALIEAKSPNPGILTMLGNGSPLVVKALLNAGADPNARAEYGLTPLYNAAIAASDPSIVEALIESGGGPERPHRKWLYAASYGGANLRSSGRRGVAGRRRGPESPRRIRPNSVRLCGRQQGVAGNQRLPAVEGRPVRVMDRASVAARALAVAGAGGPGGGRRRRLRDATAFPQGTPLPTSPLDRGEESKSQGVGLRGSATPIIESRVTRAARLSSAQPSVPSGRIGSTR